MKTLFIFLATLLPLSLHAEEKKTCAAIKQCTVQQKARAGKKTTNSKNTLKFDELCGADVHALPLKNGQELELSIKSTKVVAKLLGKDQKVLTTKTAPLAAEKVGLSHKSKELGATTINCTP